MKRLIITESKQEEKNGRTEEVAEQATHGTDPEDAIYIIQTALESISSELVDARKKVITSYYIRIKADSDLPSGSLAGDGSPAGSTPAPGTNGQQPKYGGAAARTAAESFQHMAAGKTAQFPSADSAENRGMDSLI